MTKIKFLTKTEFYDVYGISLLHGKVELSDAYILSLLIPISNKYYSLTYTALVRELEHFPRGCCIKDAKMYGWEHDDMIYNKIILKNMGIKNWQKERFKLNLDKIFTCFDSGRWADEYGGDAWARIAIACAGLQKSIFLKDVDKICESIDHLNDLEHNNAYYLEDFCSFDLWKQLEAKKFYEEKEIFLRCSDSIKELLKFKKGI